MRIWKITAVIALAFSSFAADNVAPTKTELEEMYNKAFREFEANNFSQALKELDAIDARQPDLAASQNLRGVILMRQGIYDNFGTRGLIWQKFHFSKKIGRRRGIVFKSCFRAVNPI